MQVEGSSDHIDALINVFNTLWLLNSTRVDIGLRAQDSLKSLVITLQRVDIKLANDQILELSRWPPSVRCLFEQRSCTKCNLFGHLVDRGLACHAKGHVKEHRIPDDELVSRVCALSQLFRYSVFVLIKLEYIDQVDTTNDCGSGIPLREGRSVL